MAIKTATVNVNSNVGEVKDYMKSAIAKGLEICGLTAEGYAKLLCPVDTGNLRNSITHQVEMEERAVYIGTNVKYAPYVELGTGIENVEGGTLKKSWVYRGEDGEWHVGKPMKPRPFLKPAVEDHTKEWISIMNSVMLEDLFGDE